MTHKKISVTDRLVRMMGGSDDEPQDLDAMLLIVEREADGAMPGFEAFFFNRGGDLCVREDAPRRALGYYGRAIDAYLRAGRYDSAAAVCRKILRLAPDAVRARCTLAWIAVGKGLIADASSQVDAYVQAAYRQGKIDLARYHLARMGQVAEDPDLAYQIGESLLNLGDAAAADIVFGRALAIGRGEILPSTESEERWNVVLDAALRGPQDMDETTDETEDDMEKAA